MNRIDPVKEAQAVAALRASLAAVDESDEALLLDTIEGETSLFETIDALCARIVNTRVMIAGIDTVVADLQQRQARFVLRSEYDRRLIEQAMTIAELDKIERPVATLSLTRRAPKVEVFTEADIPAEFWVASDPHLDKKALGAALKAGRDVPGAALSNCAPTLTARFK